MRKDGRRVKTAQPMYQVAAHIMDQRCDSMNMMTVDIPVEPMQAYLNKKRAEGKSIRTSDWCFPPTCARSRSIRSSTALS